MDNCILREFQWRRILSEKYPVTPAPKIYSLMTPDHDGLELSLKVKSPIPLTVALCRRISPTRFTTKLSASPTRSTKPDAKSAASSQ